ncbi:hypothetical protein J2T18_004564 [Paenibacillus polymyxa]|uniref:hypothetical protein n=1 Tax=Paenibacillus polymyxa TaxID=1406 RepID=UPI002793943A|nr:hypothetical protein [Paenibacillus polymyxa]MDQ0050236.1 hypothetical protein [Paenibacillus polymyxa]
MKKKWFTLLATLTMVAALGTSVSAAPVVPSADSVTAVSSASPSDAPAKDQATSAAAVDQSEQDAQKVVTKYLTAMHEKNFSDAVSLVKDSRYLSEEKQIQKYEEYSNRTDFDKIEVVGAQKESNSSVAVTIKEDGEKKDLKVIKDGEEWKLVLGDSNPATVKALNPSEFSTNAAVDYYRLSGVQYGTVLIGGDAFSVGSSHSATIKGWQDTGYSDVKAVNRYEIVQDVWNGWKEWSVPQKVSGNSAENDSSSWYSKSFDGIPAGSGYHIRITGLTTPDGYDSSGAGNVYVN